MNLFFSNISFLLLNTGQLDKTTTSQYVLKSTLGETQKDVINSFLNEYKDELLISFSKNMIIE